MRRLFADEHELNGENVNFLTLRSEILAAVGVTGSFVLYQRAPRLRRSFLWLLPAVLGFFAKQSALVFAPLFAVYLLTFPEERDVTTSKPAARWPWLALIAPAFLAAAAFYGLQARLAGAGLVYGSTPPRIYFQTQVYAWLHYMRLFLVPVGLSADADWSPIRDWYDTRVLVGGSVAADFLAVLRKPGALNAEERKIIEEHPVVGYDLLLPMKTMRKTLPVVYHHHERLDGSGYPEGISGHAIPMTVRIVTIADIFDALTTDRAYRGALSVATAFEILAEGVPKGWWRFSILDFRLRFGREMIRAWTSPGGVSRPGSGRWERVPPSCWCMDTRWTARCGRASPGFSRRRFAS